MWVNMVDESPSTTTVDINYGIFYYGIDITMHTL